jgi:hypothetical protein
VYAAEAKECAWYDILCWEPEIAVQARNIATAMDTTTACGECSAEGLPPHHAAPGPANLPAPAPAPVPAPAALPPPAPAVVNGSACGAASFTAYVDTDFFGGELPGDAFHCLATPAACCDKCSTSSTECRAW